MRTDTRQRTGSKNFAVTEEERRLIMLCRGINSGYARDLADALAERCPDLDPDDDPGPGRSLRLVGDDGMSDEARALERPAIRELVREAARYDDEFMSSLAWQLYRRRAKLKHHLIGGNLCLAGGGVA